MGSVVIRRVMLILFELAYIDNLISSRNYSNMIGVVGRFNVSLVL